MLVKSVFKDIQSLALKKHRDQTGHFLVEGPKMVEEILLHHRSQIIALYGLSGWVEAHHSLVQSVPVTVIQEAELARLSQLHTPHQVIAVVKQPTQPLPVATHSFTLVACGLQDPGNLGTIIRTADWFGVRQIVCSTDTVDCFNPKVVQATMGSLFRVAVHYLDLDSWLEQYKSVRILAAHTQGVDVRTLSPEKEAILLIGNESNGVPASLLQKASLSVAIAGQGQVESLNAAVATGILLSYLR